MLDDKVVQKNKSKKQLYCRQCFTRRNNICCQQVLKTNTFISYRTGKACPIFFQRNCKGPYIIYVLKYICQLQYNRKNETSFNTRLSNTIKDSKNKNAILACKHFQNSNHKFQRDAKFTLIEQITKTFATTTPLRLLLKKWENFWILKLKACYPDGLSQELNNI